MRSAVVSSRSAGGRLVALFWALVLAAATVVAGPVTTAQAAPLPATYTATASGDVLTLGATAGTTTLATADLVHAAASLDSSDPTEPASAASANLGAQVGPLGAQLNGSRVTAPPDASDSGSLVTASGEGLSTGVLTYSDSATWVSATACVADGTDISSATTTTAGAEFGLPIGDVIVTGEASVTGTTSLDQVSPTNDTRAVVATSTGSLSDISIAEGLATVAVTSDPTLTATATGTASGSGVAFTPAQATVTIGGTTTTLTAGVDTTLALPAGAGSVTFHLASSSEITNLVVAGDGTSASGDAAPLTAEITLANAPGLVTDAALLTLHAEATAPAGGVECDWTPTITIATPADGSTTTDTTPDITGTSNVTNGTIQLSLDSGTPIDVPTDASGAFSYTPTTPLTEGPHAVTATAADPGGGDPATDTSNFTVDTTPTIAISTPPDGSSTNDTTPDITGTSNVTNGTIQLSLDSGTPIDVPTDASGAFSYTPTTPLTEGPHAVTATAADPGGGDPATDTSNFTVDTTAPIVAISTPPDGSTTGDTTPDVTGTSDILNGQITLSIDGGDPITVPTDASGNFSYTPTTPLDDGPHSVTVTATDPAGNTATDTTDFTVDTTPPTIAITTPPDGSATNDSTPDITGTSDVLNGTIELSIDGGAPVAVPTDAGGNFSYTPTTPLDDGPHSVTVTATDSAGNTGSDTSAFAVDTTPPTIAITTSPDGSTTADRTPDITGTSDVLNGTIELSIDGGAPLTVPTDASGNFSYTPTTPLDEGSHTVDATATDAAGNTATDTTTFTVAIEPTITITTPPDGSLTNDSTPDITGTSDIIDGTIELSIDGGAPLTVPTDASGNFSYTPTTPLTDGPHTVEATASDPSGNTATDTTNFTVDAPPVVEITTPPDGSTTQDPTPDITGTSDILNGTITLSIDGGTPVAVATDASGNFSYTPATPLSNGRHTVLATATDAGGNTTTDSVTFFVAVNGAPTVDITDPADGSTTTDPTPDIGGTTDQPNSSVTIVIDGGAPVEVGTDGDGRFSYTPTSDLACGQHEVTVSAANGLGTGSDTSTFVVACPAGSGGTSGGGYAGGGSSGGLLAYTGANVTAVLALGAILLSVGGGLLVASSAVRRRILRARHG